MGSAVARGEWRMASGQSKCRRDALAASVGSLIRRLVLVAAVALAVRTWLVQGVFVPFQVTSGSMAPGLLGVHRNLVCGECGYRFACGFEVAPVRRCATCPNCAWAENELGALADRAGDRLVVSRAAFLLRRPRRWEVVAFRDPQEPSKIIVKRVVGLPGESIQIREGDLYVNGVIQRKALDQQQALAVPVYDADFPPRYPALPPRWRVGTGPTGWRFQGTRFLHPAVATTGEIDWLTYAHWVRPPRAPDPLSPLPATHSLLTRESPITNTCAYNQVGFEHGEESFVVRDLMLEFRWIKASGPGRLLVRATDGRERFLVEIEPAQGSFRVLRGDGASPIGQGRIGWNPGDLRVLVSLIDRQFLLAFNGRPAMVYPYGASSQAATACSRPFAIGSDGLGAEIAAARLFKDVYYTRPPGVSGRWGVDQECRLGATEYFVLGDNSVVSDDSRSWPQGPGVDAQLLMGKPLAIGFPVWRATLAGGQAPVPDLGRIRYIR